MDCNTLRKLMIEATRDPIPASWSSHLDSCASCAQFAGRLIATRKQLREHHAGIRPDAGFASRVVAQLPVTRVDALGWAAMRLLPATLALAFLLAWFSLQAFNTADPTLDASASASPTEDLLGWVLDPDGGDS